MSQLSRVWGRLKYIALGSETVRCEAILASCLIGWCIILLITRPDLFTTSPSYKTLADTTYQWVWGILFAVTAAIITVGLLGRFIWLRIAGSTLGIFCWSSITWTFILNAATPTGYVVYGIFAVTSALITLHHIVYLRDKPTGAYK